MLAAGHWTARLGFRTRWLSLQQGCLTAIWVDPMQDEKAWPRYFGGVFANATYRIRWLPSLERHLSLRYLYLPLWMPIPVLLAVSGLLYWRDRRRSRRGCCPACGYDLTGNTTGVCPECGWSVPPTTPLSGSPTRPTGTTAARSVR